MEADRLSLEDAGDMIRAAGDNINLSISNVEDQELLESEELAKALALSASELEDSEEQLSHDALRSEASEVETSEVLHSETTESEIPHSESEVYHTDSEAHRTTSASARTDTGEVSLKEADADSVSSAMSKSSVRSDVSESSTKSQPKMEEEEEQFVDVNSLPLLPPRPAPEREKAVRKCWHPVMLDTSPPPIIEETTGDEEYPHKKTIRLLKQMIAEKKVTPTPETLIFFLCNKFAVSEERANKISL